MMCAAGFGAVLLLFFWDGYRVEASCRNHLRHAYLRQGRRDRLKLSSTHGHRYWVRVDVLEAMRILIRSRACLYFL